PPDRWAAARAPVRAGQVGGAPPRRRELTSDQGGRSCRGDEEARMDRPGAAVKGWGISAGRNLVPCWCGPAVLAALVCAGCGGPAPAAPAARSDTAPAALVAAASTPSAPAAVQPLSPPVTVKLGRLTTLSDAAVYIAQSRGYLAEEGLEVEITRVNGAAEAMPHLMTGQLDAAGVTAAAGFFNAINRGLPLRIAGDKGRQT